MKIAFITVRPPLGWQGREEVASRFLAEAGIRTLTAIHEEVLG